MVKIAKATLAHLLYFSLFIAATTILSTTANWTYASRAVPLFIVNSFLAYFNSQAINMI
jgi:hypothetical protein